MKVVLSLAFGGCDQLGTCIMAKIGCIGYERPVYLSGGLAREFGNASLSQLLDFGLVLLDERSTYELMFVSQELRAAEDAEFETFYTKNNLTEGRFTSLDGYYRSLASCRNRDLSSEVEKVLLVLEDELIFHTFGSPIYTGAKRSLRPGQKHSKNG